MIQHYFLSNFLVIYRIYNNLVPSKSYPILRKIAKNWKKMREIKNSCIFEYELNHTTNCSIWLMTTF